MVTFGFCNKNINSSVNSEINFNNIGKINNIVFQNIYDRNLTKYKKNAILGVIVRYSWKSISPFFLHKPELTKDKSVHQQKEELLFRVLFL